jgi:hypothetical protein
LNAINKCYIQDSDLSKLISFIDNLSCLDKEADESFISLKIKHRDEILKNIKNQSEMLSLFLKLEESVSRMKKSEVQQIINSLK